MKSLFKLLLLLALIQSCEYKTVRLEGYEVHGIDVSHHQNKIAWDSVSNEKINFAFVKATEGATHQDSQFGTNWKEMKRVGIKRGAYHFFRPQTPAEQQAVNFMNMVEMEYGDLPPVLDVEVLDEVSKVHLISRMRTWLYMIELHYDIRPIIYTNQKFYNNYLAGHFEEYHIWIARYSSRRPILRDGKKWQFWQYGDEGQVNGIDGFVDYNVFKGSIYDLDELCFWPKPILSLL